MSGSAASHKSVRIDQEIAVRFPGVSRRKARELLAQHRVLLNERPVSVASREVAPSDRISIIENDQEIAILRSTADWLAANKATGMAVQPDRERVRRSLHELLLSQLKRNGQPHSLYVIHRIDTGTSGVVLFARSQAAAARLSARFAAGEIRKTYLALVEGRLESERTIETPIRDRSARTMVRPRQSSGEQTLVEVEIQTGRTHQIRIHLASTGHPIVGDRRYGSTVNASRLMLHAWRLEHDDFGLLEAPIPPDFV